MNLRNTPDLKQLSDTQVDQTGDVIEFYNAVFIPSTKAFLLQLGNGTANLLPLPHPDHAGHAPCMAAWPPTPTAWPPLRRRTEPPSTSASRLPAKCSCRPCASRASR